jgi:hypothetical protein
MIRYTVFVDEAGTSANEPATLAVGVIVPEDCREWMEAALAEALGKVPDGVGSRPYEFHATEVVNTAYGDKWPVRDRLAFLEEIMTIPLRGGGAVVLGLTMPAPSLLTYCQGHP